MLLLWNNSTPSWSKVLRTLLLVCLITAIVRWLQDPLSPFWYYFLQGFSITLFVFATIEVLLRWRDRRRSNKGTLSNQRDHLPLGGWALVILAFIPTAFLFLFIPFYVSVVCHIFYWPLDRPIRTNNLERIGELLRRDPQIVHSQVAPMKGPGWTNYDWEPIHLAASEGNTQVVELLLNSGAEIDSHGQEGYALTPLYIAAREGKTETVRLLIGKGADVNAGEQGGRTPLQIAMEQGFAEVCELLIQAGAKGKN